MRDWPLFVLYLLLLAGMVWLAGAVARALDLAPRGALALYVAAFLGAVVVLILLILWKERREFSVQHQASDRVERDARRIVSRWLQALDRNALADDRGRALPEPLERLLGDLDSYALHHDLRARDRGAVAAAVEETLRDAELPNDWDTIAPFLLLERWGI